MTITILLAAAGVAGYTDLRTRRIPNWLTGGMVVYGLLLHSVRTGWSGVLLSLGGLALGMGLILIPMLIPFAKRGMGGGDVKFIAAVGSIVGAEGVLLVFALAAALGAIMSTLALRKQERTSVVRGPWSVVRDDIVRGPWSVVRGKRQNAVIAGGPRDNDRPTDGGQRATVTIPYGVALSFGTAVVAVGSWIVSRGS